MKLLYEHLESSSVLFEVNAGETLSPAFFALRDRTFA